jgi:hypothetical protein
MGEIWKCWDRLEELELKILNKRATREHSSSKARRRRTAQDVREMCFRLRSFPRLITLEIEWDLRTSWGRGRSGMTLALRDLNENAVKSGSATMTIKDAAWVGLKLD